MSTGAGPLFGSNQFALPTTGGSNQWMSYPSLPSGGMNAYSGTENTPLSSVSSSQTSPTDTSTNPFANVPTQTASAPTGNTPGGAAYVGHGYYESPTYDPGFTGNFYQMLQSMMSGGGGQLQQQLLSFLSGGPSSIPGANQLENLSQTGGLISALPEWQSMVAAMGQNTAQNEANLKEQFASMGSLDSSPFGTAMSNYLQQTNLDQNALLGQLDTQAMQQAVQNELTASTSLTGMAGAESQFLDQLFSGAATASPTLNKKGQSSILGGIGSLLGGVGSLASSNPWGIFGG
jgi:hypothetical protein